MKVLGLFSGIGGFELGLQRAGFEIAAMCEIDPYCRKVLRKHWPTVKIYHDVRELTSEQLQADGIAPDVICGGFPCQDISAAGFRVGIEGARSGLWTEYARLIREILPRYVIVENVDDLLIRGMDRVLGDLASLGYDAEWHSIPAAAVGADHWRDRVWIVAYPDSARVFPLHEQRRQSRTREVGEAVAADVADDHGARLQGWREARTLAEDARAISPWLGLAFCSAPAFPGLDGAGSPVLGRGEDGIPDRVDRIHALGNAVVPQIPEMIGRAILAAEAA